MTEKTPLFLVNPNADLVQMRPSAPGTEDELQDLIARYPALIGDSDGALLLVEREHGVPDAVDGAARWSIDHLFVTRQATPVLVEVKRAVDTRLRREVVGQMLDYAANGVAFWPEGGIAGQFEDVCKARGEDPNNVLAAFLGEDANAGEYWAQVDANLRAGRIKLVFVADEIPAELARIVEFLNDQMRADVRAVELNYYDSPEGLRMLAPRIIGETERARAQKAGGRPRLEPISVDDWLEKHIAPRGPQVLNGARSMLEVMRALVDEVDVASTQGSIYARLPRKNGKSTYPFFLVRGGAGQIGFGWLGGSPALEGDTERKRFYDKFSEAVGPLTTTNLHGFPAFALDRLTDPRRLEVFRTVAREFVDACRA